MPRPALTRRATPTIWAAGRRRSAPGDRRPRVRHLRPAPGEVAPGGGRISTGSSTTTTTTYAAPRSVCGSGTSSRPALRPPAGRRPASSACGGATRDVGVDALAVEAVRAAPGWAGVVARRSPYTILPPPSPPDRRLLDAGRATPTTVSRPAARRRHLIGGRSARRSRFRPGVPPSAPQSSASSARLGLRQRPPGRHCVGRPRSPAVAPVRRPTHRGPSLLPSTNWSRHGAGSASTTCGRHRARPLLRQWQIRASTQDPVAIIDPRRSPPNATAGAVNFRQRARTTRCAASRGLGHRPSGVQPRGATTSRAPPCPRLSA
jgi:hypothetical protein